jgi:hypothetical protein
LRLVCKALCDTIGDRVTTVIFRGSYCLPLPTSRLRRITNIKLEEEGFKVPAPESRQFVDSLIAVAKNWEHFKSVELTMNGNIGIGTRLDYILPLAFGRTPFCLRKLHLEGRRWEPNPRILPILFGANLTGLRSLSLRKVLLCDNDITTLAAAPPALWASLETLSIFDERGETLCVADVLYAAALHLTTLRELVIKEGTIRAHGARLLERVAQLLPELRSIHLFNVLFEPGAAVPLLHAILVKSLEELVTYNVNIGNEGAQALAAAAAGLPRMRHFSLSDARTGYEEDMNVVQAAVEHWPMLETLILHYIPLDARAARVLIDAAPNLPSLTKLRLRGFHDSLEMQSIMPQLIRAFPDVSISYR